MKRLFSIAILLTALRPGGPAFAQETSAVPGLDWKSFQSIADKNIFDPTRTGAARFSLAPKPKAILRFTFAGTLDRLALFTGEGTAQRKGCFAEDDLINGFKLMKVTLHDVTLTQPDGGIVVLQKDQSMQRIEDGPWTKSEDWTPPADVVSSPSSTSVSSFDTGGTPAPASPGPAGESDILKRLREKREQEDK